TDGANAQGAHRFARGQNFVAVSARQAAALGAPYNWRMQVVPGVGHEQAKMADAAGAALFGR
ncbi:MAG: hydrolase, partial [Bosea sp. (in: a-proteobacteria)]